MLPTSRLHVHQSKAVLATRVSSPAPPSDQTQAVRSQSPCTRHLQSPTRRSEAKSAHLWTPGHVTHLIPETSDAHPQAAPTTCELSTLPSTSNTSILGEAPTNQILSSPATEPEPSQESIHQNQRRSLSPRAAPPLSVALSLVTTAPSSAVLISTAKGVAHPWRLGVNSIVLN